MAVFENSGKNGPKWAQNLGKMDKNQKSKKQVLFVFQNLSLMQNFKKIEANGEEFYYFQGLFKGLFHVFS